MMMWSNRHEDNPGALDVGRVLNLFMARISLAMYTVYELCLVFKETSAKCICVE